MNMSCIEVHLYRMDCGLILAEYQEGDWKQYSVRYEGKGMICPVSEEEFNHMKQMAKEVHECPMCYSVERNEGCSVCRRMKKEVQE